MRALARLGFLGLTLVARPAAPDEIYLRGGGKVTGVIVERTARAIMIETGPGRVGLPVSRIERIVEGRSALETYRERAARLAARDLDGWTALARWAAERDLATQAGEAWHTVLALDPSHAEANAALGRVELDGRWVSMDEAYRARGYVPFEGRWVTPAEHEILLREQAIEAASARQRREEELRVREAEARAREAEARARQAEAAATSSSGTVGIPYWWVLAGGAGGRGRPHPRPHTAPVQPPVIVEPPPATRPPASITPPTPRSSPPTKSGALTGPHPAARPRPD